MIENIFTPGGRPELDIRIQSGRVELIPSANETVRVTVDTKDPNFIVEQRGDLILISSDREAGWLSRSSAQVVVETRDWSDAIVRTASARIDGQVSLRKFEAKTASGDVELGEGETVVVKTASGDASVGSAQKALRFSSASGDLRLFGSVSGTVVVSTASGDVHISDTDATLEAETVSGNIVIARFAGRHASIKSMSGNVNLGIPEGTKLDLDASLLSGRVNLPHRRDDGSPRVREMSVRAKLVSGDLTISRLDA